MSQYASNRTGREGGAAVSYIEIGSIAFLAFAVATYPNWSWKCWYERSQREIEPFTGKKKEEVNNGDHAINRKNIRK